MPKYVDAENHLRALNVRQLLVGNEDSALRDALEECTHPCMRRQPIILSQSWTLSAATATRFASR